MKKILSAILVLCMLLTGASAFAAVEVHMEYPLVDEKVTMSMALLRGAVAGDPDEMWFWPYFEKLSNVHWELDEIDTTVWSDKKTIMLASGDYPDVFWGPDFTTSEIMTYGAEGIFIPLNDLIKEYMPNLTELLDTYDAWAAITAPDGNIYSLPYFNLDDYSGMRAWINQNWLDNLGLDKPTTLDEFYDVLLTFKEQDANGNGDPDDEIPWGGTYLGNVAGRSIVLSALGFINNENTPVAVKDGVACYMPLHEDYRLYLEFANKCWEAGLMDPDIFTQTETQFQAKAMEMVVGYSSSSAPHVFVGYDEEAWSQYTHIIPLTSEVNDTRIWYKPEVVGVGTMMVTDLCEMPEVALRWMDMLYDPNWAVLFHNGPILGTDSDPDGIGWDPATGTTEPLGLTQANPTDLGWWDYLCEYMVPRGRGTAWFATINDYYALDNATIIDYNRVLSGEEGYWRTENAENAGEYFISGYPNVMFYTEEEVQIMKELLTPLTDYVELMEAKFITGAESFDNYDSFIEELKKLGAEQIDEIYRTNYESYLAR